MNRTARMRDYIGDRHSAVLTDRRRKINQQATVHAAIAGLLAVGLSATAPAAPVTPKPGQEKCYGIAGTACELALPLLLASGLGTRRGARPLRLQYRRGDLVSRPEPGRIERPRAVGRADARARHPRAGAQVGRPVAAPRR
jgi:hypothetical protein